MRGMLGNKQDGYLLSTWFISLEAHSFVIYHIGDEVKRTMAVALQVSAIQPFDTHGDANSLCQRWERWLKLFELYVGASGVTDDTQKRQLLLHCAGMDVQDVFYTLTGTGTEYKTAKEKLTAYYTPRKKHLVQQTRVQKGRTEGR